MRITFFTDYFRPEPPPPAHHIAERAAAWVRDGQQVTIVTNHPNYPEGRVYAGHRNSMRALESVDGYRIVRVWTHVASHSSNFGKLVDQASFTVSAVMQALREPAPDVVVASSPHLFAGLAGAVYARLVRRPFLLEVRDLWPDSVLRPGSIAYRAFKVIERIIYRSADVVTVLTPAFEEHVRREGARAVRTIVGGADLRRFAPGLPSPALLAPLGLEGRFVIGYPGTLGTAHDIRLLVEAAKLLRETDIRFLIVGGGPYADRLRALVEAECPGMVVFAGTQPPERMPEWWRAMDVGLVLLRNSPELSTVIPSKMFEAMATSRPILFVGPGGAGSAIVERHGAGIVVDDGLAESFADAARVLRDDAAARERMAAAALAASPSFSRERHARESLDALASIVEGRRS